jgi:hypothetical protein
MVSDVLCSQLAAEEEVMAYNEDGELVGTGTNVRTASPATLAAAIKFLKDNSITSEIDKDENLSNLAAKLAKKQKQSRLDTDDAGKAAKLYAV